MIGKYHQVYPIVWVWLKRHSDIDTVPHFQAGPYQVLLLRVDIHDLIHMENR